MRNLEIKVRVTSLDGIRDRLHSAEYKCTLEQKDTYYLLGKRRLKVREEKSKSEVIYYRRALCAGTRASTYWICALPSVSVPFMKFFLHAICGTKFIVKKTRDLYLFKHTRIHLDAVRQLGTFVELETVIHKEGSDASYVKEHDEVKCMLAIDNYPAIAGSYSDLLEHEK